MRAAWFRARTELRSRWKAALSLALLAAVGGGAIMGTAAAARRTDSAYPRFVERYRGADIGVGNFPGGQVVTPEAVEGIPGAAAVERFRFVALNVEGKFAMSFARTDPSPRTDLFKIIRGRMPDPGRADEAVATLHGAEHGLRTGQTFDLATFGDETGDFGALAAAIAAKPLRMRIVGVAAVPGGFPPQVVETAPMLYLTPAFARAYPGAFAGVPDSVMVRLERTANLSDYRAALARASGGSLVAFLNRRGQDANVQRSLHLQALAMWILAGLAAILVALVVAQTVVRQVSMESADQPTLAALGMSPGEQTLAIVLRHASTAAVAALLGCAFAVVSSMWTPFGIARVAEPSPGVRADAFVLGAGAAAVTLLVAGAAFAGAAIANRRVRGAAPARAGLASVAKVALPPAASAGLRFALEPGHGSRAVPVRTAIAGVGVAILGLVATLTFAASLTHLLDDSSLYGVTWDMAIDVENIEGFDDAQARRLAAVPGVGDVSIGNLGLDIVVNGVAVEGMAIGGDILPPILTGRMPSGDAEIALGPRTLSRLGVRLGDTVTMTAEGADLDIKLRVVGTALMASANETTRIGDGSVLPVPVFMKIGELLDIEGFAPGTAFVNLSPGASRSSVRAALVKEFAPGTTFDEVVFEPPVATPSDIVSFGRVRNLPFVLVSILAVFSALTLAHTLVTATRRRRRDLAILKTLGFVRGQVARSIAVQATAMTTLALVVAVPLGVAAGRWAWTALARDLGVIGVPVVPGLAVALAIPAALLLANVVSAGPAAVAARTQPAAVLRSE